MALVIEHGTYPLLRLMIKICSYDIMKLEADKSLKIFHVHSNLMGFFSPFIIWKFCVIQHFIYIVLFYPVRVDDNLLKDHFSAFFLDSFAGQPCG